MLLEFFALGWLQYSVKRSFFAILPEGREYEAVFTFSERVPVEAQERMRRRFRREVLELQFEEGWGYFFFVSAEEYGIFAESSRGAR